MKNNLWIYKLYTTVGGVGLLPLAPGTWGAAVGVLCLIPLSNQSENTYFLPLFIGSIIITWTGAFAAKKLEHLWGEDPKQCVIDEFVGVWVAILGHTLSWQNLLAAFVLFRIFDIWKPLGIRRFEAIPNGWGVMLDDVAAGIVANAVLWAAIYASHFV